MAIPIFITGIGTGVGKTLVSAIVTEALQADYWKPVQTGLKEGTDSDWVRGRISNPVTRIHPECYRLELPASPHLAAARENVHISMDVIASAFNDLATDNQYVVIEGAGGLLVPLADGDFMLDLALRLQAKVILVSRRYLGSINHSLLTARVCRAERVSVAGWIFNEYTPDQTEELVKWSGYPRLGGIPGSENPDASFVRGQAERLKDALLNSL